MRIEFTDGVVAEPARINCSGTRCTVYTNLPPNTSGFKTYNKGCLGEYVLIGDYSDYTNLTLIRVGYFVVEKVTTLKSTKKGVKK